MVYRDGVLCILARGRIPHPLKWKPGMGQEKPILNLGVSPKITLTGKVDWDPNWQLLPFWSCLCQSCPSILCRTPPPVPWAWSWTCSRHCCYRRSHAHKICPLAQHQGWFQTLEDSIGSEKSSGKQFINQRVEFIRNC